MSINNNPDQLEQPPIAQPTEEDAAVMLEGQEPELVMGEGMEPVIEEGGMQQAGLGKVFGEAGEVITQAIKGSPRPPAPTAASQAAADTEATMSKIGDFTDPAAVDVTRWNSEYIDDVEDINNVLQGTHDFWDFEGQHPALKKQSHNETIQKAQAMSDDEFATTVLKYKAGDAWNSQTINRGRMMMTSLASEIYEYAGKIGHEITEPSGRTQWKLTTQSEEELFELHRKLNVLSAVQYATEGAVSEAGRSLNSMKIKVGSQMLDQSNISEKYNRIGGIATTEKLLNMVMNGDFADMTKTARAVKGNKWWNLTKDLWYFGMLSGISTHEKNIIGNTIVSLNGVSEKYQAMVWGQAFDKSGVNAAAGAVGDLTGSKGIKEWGMSHEDRIKLEDANDFAVGTISGYILAFKLLGKRLKESSKQMVSDATGGKVLPEGGLPPEKVDVGHVAYEDGNRIRGMSADNLGINPESVQGKAVNFFGDWVVGSAGNALGTMDDFYKTIAFEQSIMYQSRRAARAQLGDAYNDPDKLYPLLREMRENPPETMTETSIEFARQQTFTDDLDSMVGKWMMQGTAIPIINAFVPYVRTVSNILRYGVDRTPVLGQLPFVTNFWKEIKAGGATRDQAMARLSTGGIMAGVANMMYLGETKEVKDPETGHMVQINLPNFTGAGSGNYKVRKLMMQAGWQPYSIRDPETGKYTPYDWIEPFGTMFGSMATTLETLHNTYDEDKQREIHEALVMGMAEYTMDKSYMTGFADMLDILQGDKSFQRWASKFAATIAVPAVVRNARKDTDPIMRGSDAGGVLDYFLRDVKNRSPWHSEEVAPYVGVWGEELRYGDPMFKYHYISPAATRRITDDKLTKELAKLYKPNQEDANRFSLRTPSPVIKWNVKTPAGDEITIQVDLKDVDPSGWAYSDYQKIVGKARRKIAEEFVNDSEWEDSTPDSKYMQMSRAFNFGVKQAGTALTYNDTDDVSGAKEFLQKYSDPIQLEADRIFAEKLNFQGGQFDYTSTIPTGLRDNEPKIKSAITQGKPEF